MKLCALMVVMRWWCHFCFPCFDPCTPPPSPHLSTHQHSPLSQLLHHLIWCFIDLFSLLLVLASQHRANKGPRGCREWLVVRAQSSVCVSQSLNMCYPYVSVGCEWLENCWIFSRWGGGVRHISGQHTICTQCIFHVLIIYLWKLPPDHPDSRRSLTQYFKPTQDWWIWSLHKVNFTTNVSLIKTCVT